MQFDRTKLDEVSVARYKRQAAKFAKVFLEDGREEAEVLLTTLGYTVGDPKLQILQWYIRQELIMNGWEFKKDGTY